MTKEIAIKKWDTFLEKKKIQPAIKISLMAYVTKLINQNIPIIFEFEHLCHLLGRQNKYLASVINAPSNHYYSFQIKKRSGGKRIITSPYPALLELQYWILNNILKTIPISNQAHGFAPKKSIITNAKIHIAQKEILKIDLKDFFPSIQINRIIHVFKTLGYPNEIAFYLASICSYKQHLPQGAPTSPCLSNIIAKKLDYRMIQFSKKFNLKYTRYADDLTFSGDKIPSKIIEYLNTIITEEGYTVNRTKTRLYKTKRIITGISVAEAEIKIPRQYKRALKTELHCILKYGVQSHLAKKKIKKNNYLLSVFGKITFWLSVEPKNQYALQARKQIIETYGQSLVV